jgi:sugar lactone lactonase YvrE
MNIIRPSGALLFHFSSKLSRCVQVAVVTSVLGLLLGAGTSLAATITDFAGTGTSGTPTPGLATSSELGGPDGLAVDSAGNTYVADNAANEVLKVTPSGTLSVFAGTGATGAPTSGSATSSAVFAPTGVALDSSGNVYISTNGMSFSGNQNYVLKVTPSGTLSIFAGMGNTGAPTPGAATSSDLYDPAGIAVDPSGNLYIANFGSNEILKVTPGGTLSIFAGTGTQGASSAGPATSSNLNGPNGVAVDSSGNVYIADTGNKKVEKVTTSGTLSTIAGTGTQGTPTPGPATSSNLGQISGVAVDVSGDVYFSDANNAEVDKVSGGVLSVVAGTGSFGAPTFGGPATSSDLAGPRGLVTEGTSLYISDLINAVVARVGAPLPVSTASPAITGVAQSGQTLTTSSGSWSNSPTVYAYQWQLCDAGASNCADISGAATSSYTLTSSDVGQTVRVVVTAQNAGGPASADSAVTGIVQPASTSTPPTTTTTGTTPTTPTTTTTPTTPTGRTPTHGTAPAPVDAVQVSPATVSAGLTASAVGAVALPLACPATAVAGCDADGTLAVTLEGTEGADAAAISSSVIARFSGIEIQAGHSRLVAVKLSPQAISYLRAHGIARVRVTLTTHNSLSGGQVVTFTQSLWLDVSALTGCHVASGAITNRRIGRLAPGMSRAAAHRTGRYTVGRGKWENYCVAGGNIQAAYPHHTHAATRIVIILTANHHYAIRGIHAGASLKTARVKLHLGTGIRAGKTTWFFLRGAHATRVVQARHGRIVRVGLASRRATSTRAQQRRTLHSLR